MTDRDAMDDYHNLVEDRNQLREHNESLQSQLAAERARADKAVSDLEFTKKVLTAEIAAHDADCERADGLQAVVEAAKALLTRIGDYAHDHSTGPSEPDALWEIRSMAYNGEDLAAPVPAQPVAVPEGLALSRIAAISHTGGLASTDELDALSMIRWLSKPWFDNTGTLRDLKARVDAAILSTTEGRKDD